MTRHVWITDVEFAWALREFLTRYGAEFQDEPQIPWPLSEDVYSAADTVVAINRPVFGHRRYRTLAEKLGGLTYELGKRHFFLNGNKRIGYFFLLYILRLNGKAFHPSTVAERVELMERIAASDPADRLRVIRETAELIAGWAIPLPSYARPSIGSPPPKVT